MYLVVFVTARNVEEAHKISEGLIDEKLIACANIVSGVQSIFVWEGKVDKAQEVLLILKTRKTLLSKIIKKVKAIHSYDCPEVIALPIMDGNKDYLKWVGNSTVKP